MLKAKKSLNPKVTKRQLKEDQFITKIFELYDLGRKYQKEISYVIIAIIAVIALSYWVQQDKVVSEQNAAVELSRGKAAFESGQFDEAIDILTALSQNFDGTMNAGAGLIYLGKAYGAKNDYVNQEKYFQIYLDDYNDDDLLSVAAMRGLAVSYDERGDFAKAAQVYADAVDKFQDGYNAPQFLLDAAKCYLLADNLDAAKKCLEKIVVDYEKSPSLSEAKRLLAENSD
ncbi:MAG: hypothetical protein DWQ05_09810 [Calditrichaeota bacterium]|nr:MAG: hypothetical protein DWQ05_09810 [Calditrichota bacterium]